MNSNFMFLNVLPSSILLKLGSSIRKFVLCLIDDRTVYFRSKLCVFWKKKSFSAVGV